MDLMMITIIIYGKVSFGTHNDKNINKLIFSVIIYFLLFNKYSKRTVYFYFLCIINYLKFLCDFTIKSISKWFAKLRIVWVHRWCWSRLDYCLSKKSVEKCESKWVINNIFSDCILYACNPQRRHFNECWFNWHCYSTFILQFDLLGIIGLDYRGSWQS